ncbi:MAG: sialidase family protein [Pirellulales bacterium]
MYRTISWGITVAILAFACSTVAAAETPDVLPADWDAKQAGDKVMARLINTSAPRVKGTHDAEFVCVGDRAYVVSEANDVKEGESAGWPYIYATLSIVDLNSLKVVGDIEFARTEQKFENETLPVGACFVPRIIQKDATTLRCYFTSEDPGKRQSQMWYRDFDLKSQAFAPTIHRAKLRTAAGTFDMQPQYFHADAKAQGFKKPAADHGLFLFDSFKQFDGRTYVTLNNFPGKQNALALMHDDFATFEVVGHYNEPQQQSLSESSVNRLPDGTWTAICRNDKGNYHFTTSPDGRSWTVGKPATHVPNGLNSKPTFDKFGDLYYLGWQEASDVDGVRRSVFNLDVSRDGRTWLRKYRFETKHSFQYATFHEHRGAIWLAVTQGDHPPTWKERIMFGKLEDLADPQSPAQETAPDDKTSSTEETSRHASALAEIRVIDEATGQGVPLVELETVNGLRYVTDNSGRVALLEPGLMDREIYFQVQSHGYEAASDGFGFRGARVVPTAGKCSTITLKRTNIAERLCRLTGEGRFRDSLLLGYPSPPAESSHPGLVAGQDSIQAAVYRGKVYCFWGDTLRMNYPLGLYRMAGAVIDVPQVNDPQTDPRHGLAYDYFVDNKTGFARAMMPLTQRPEGVVWVEAVFTVLDKDGVERLVGHYSRRKGLTEELEQGIAVYNDEQDIFEPRCSSRSRKRGDARTGIRFDTSLTVNRTCCSAVRARACAFRRRSKRSLIPLNTKR